MLFTVYGTARDLSVHKFFVFLTCAVCWAVDPT